MKRYDDGEARGFRSVVARGGGPLVLRALGRAGRGVGSTAGVEGAASEVVVERVLCRMREVVDWRGVDLHAAPLRETRREYGWPSQPWRREFAPSDTQEFSLPLQKAGEFKGLLPVPPGPGDDGDAEGTGVNGGSRHGRLSGESTRWRSKM